MSVTRPRRLGLGIGPAMVFGLASLAASVLAADFDPQVPVEIPPVTVLNKRLAVVQMRTPSWHIAVRSLASQNKIPCLLELDTLSLLDMTTRYKMGLFDKPLSEKESSDRLTKYKFELKNATFEEALREILKSDPRYTYELTEGGRCLHVFPRGILERSDWPLNHVVSGFHIDDRSTNNQWYRKVFGPFLFQHKVHIGIFRENGLDRRLKLKRYDDISLRQLLMALAVTLDVGWTIEPLPEEEIAVRETLAKRGICDYRGYDIGQPIGPGWCQLHCHPLFPPPGVRRE